MDQPGDGGVGIFGERVAHFTREGCDLICGGDNLFTDGVLRVIRINQGYKVGRDIHPKEARLTECFAFTLGEGQDLFKILN